jgi:uncharacterized protein (DUF433 family)
MIEEYLEEYPVSYLCPRITIKKGRCDGLPCVRGTDVPVKVIAILAEEGLTQDEIFQIYPSLTMEDLIDIYSYYQGLSNMFSYYEKFKLTHPFLN